jgi:hypothetical protein
VLWIKTPGSSHFHWPSTECCKPLTELNKSPDDILVPFMKKGDRCVLHCVHLSTEQINYRPWITTRGWKEGCEAVATRNQAGWIAPLPEVLSQANLPIYHSYTGLSRDMQKCCLPTLGYTFQLLLTKYISPTVPFATTKLFTGRWHTSWLKHNGWGLL